MSRAPRGLIGTGIQLQRRRCRPLDPPRCRYGVVVSCNAFFASVGPDGAADPGATATRERAKARLATLPR